MHAHTQILITCDIATSNECDVPKLFQIVGGGDAGFVIDIKSSAKYGDDNYALYDGLRFRYSYSNVSASLQTLGDTLIPSSGT